MAAATTETDNNFIVSNLMIARNNFGSTRGLKTTERCGQIKTAGCLTTPELQLKWLKC